jgi:hypothetical protein
LEEVLDVYAQPYNPAEPVICFDERPCFLIEDVKSPIPMSEGQTKREHYTYQKNGSAAFLAYIEPLVGHRDGIVYDQRTGLEFTSFFQHIAKQYKTADKIHVVLDNLNTHSFASFYKYLSAQEAFELKNRFVFHFTPKCSSWLNMIEIEFSALSRHALKGRIPSTEVLKEKLEAAIAYRNERKIKIQWQFSIQKARQTFNAKYNSVCDRNLKIDII